MAEVVARKRPSITSKKTYLVRPRPSRSIKTTKVGASPNRQASQNSCCTKVYKHIKFLVTEPRWRQGSQHQPYCLPLIKAMARVIGVERQPGQTDGANPSDLADLQTITAVVSASLQSHHRRKLMSKALGKNINQNKELLIGHKKRIQHRHHGLLKRRIASKQSP